MFVAARALSDPSGLYTLLFAKDFRSIVKMSSVGSLHIQMSVSATVSFLLINLILFSSAAIVNKNAARNSGIQSRVIEITESFSSKLESSRIQKVVNKKQNSDIVVGEDVGPESQIVFECTAPFTIQWVYEGSGMPEYSTNTSVVREEYSQYSNRRTKFIASASLGYPRTLGAHDSGKYICRSLQDSDLSIFYNLYAGGGGEDKNLFANSDGETITFKRTDETVIIPCSVSNPRAVVTLQKSVNGLVQCPMNESISFEPDKGFILRLSHFQDTAGVYVCTAGFNDTFQVAKYTLVGDGPQTVRCVHDSVCSSREACLNNVCRSPCDNYCAENAECITVDHRPICSCPPGFRGDGYRQCYRYPISTSRPQNQPHPDDLRDPCEPNPCGPYANCNSNNRFISCACQPGYFGQPPRCRPECTYDGDCPYDRSCINLRCRNPCDGACLRYPSRACRVINRQPVCHNPQGPYSLKLAAELEHITSAEKAVLRSNSTKACDPNPCGKNTICRSEQQYNKIYNTSAEVAVCKCKPYYHGDAYEECFALQRYYSDSPESESQSVEFGSLQDGEPGEGPTDEPVPTTKPNADNGSCKCGKGAVCNAESECSCPSYLEGNPYIECRRRYCVTAEDCRTVFENPVCTFNECHEALKVTIAKRCGANAISTVVNGKVACSCPENYSGIASIECHPKMQLRVNESESLEKPCDTSPCGKNAVCTPKNGIAVCECMSPFLGNPLIGCELQCSSDSDCPQTHSCFKKSQMCVDPCDIDNQSFFTECGKKAKCKVQDHAPICYCPPEYPHGSPNTECKEKSWMKESALVTQRPCDKNEANCGENAQCQGAKRCVCEPGFYGDPYGKPGCQSGLECNINNQCPPTQECFNGKCLDPCRRKRVSCSANSGCRAENHQAVCTCKIGTIRNPSGQCEYVTGALAERFSFFRAFEDVE